MPENHLGRRRFKPTNLSCRSTTPIVPIAGINEPAKNMSCRSVDAIEPVEPIATATASESRVSGALIEPLIVPELGDVAAHQF